MGTGLVWQQNELLVLDVHTLDCPMPEVITTTASSALHTIKTRHKKMMSCFFDT